MVIGAARQKLRPQEAVTGDQLQAFINLCFEDWETGDEIDLPRFKPIEADLKDIGFAFGISAEAAVASAKESGKKKPRSRAQQKLHTATARLTTICPVSRASQSSSWSKWITRLG